MRLALSILLALVCLADATTTTTTLAPVSTKEAGTITTAQVVSGAGNGLVCVKGHASVLVIDMVGSSTPSASFQVEHSTDNTSWAPLTTPSYVVMTAIALSTSPTSASVAIPDPVGCYRTNITTYASGSFTATYELQLSP